MNKKELEDSIEATIKAICKNEKLDIHFNLNELDFASINQHSFSGKQVFLPNFFAGSDARTMRGFGDLAAIYLKLHDKEIHKKNLPDFSSQKLFDDFEKFRLIKQGCAEFRGMAINLEEILLQNLEKIQDYSFLPFLLLGDDPVFSSELTNKLKAYNKIIGKDLAAKINQLSKLTKDQEAFSGKVLELLEFLNNQEQKESENKKPSEKNQEKPEEKTDEPEEKEEKNNEQETEIKTSQTAIANEQKKEIKATDQKILEVLESLPTEGQSNSKTDLKFVFEYKIFTKKFDQIIKAENLSNTKELENLRHQLDLKLEKLQKISKHLTGKLKRKLLAKKQIFCEFNKEDGLLDRKKLGQIIAKPFFGNSFMTIREDDYQNTTLSILLDNSGSMRGTPIVMSAMAAEIIAKIFEGFGIKTEILGFTTSDWRGGQSKKLWEEIGRPENPGRLSDLRHIIYKHADKSFKKSRNNLALMLKDGILKENIDGEALIWASTRLKNRSEKRKILLVISDGTPVDDSTNSNNNHDILSDHLHQTIHRLEKHSKIEIAAIGIGHNVGDFYHNSITVQNLEELGDVMINKICDLL
ncbi:MAG: Cobalamin biosynthesis protein CobT,cobalamin biosynthesis protein CobT family [Rickettsiaceae bacterium]|jgi:cobaltochelatase CobT|nr:Cobalamin biosynthesis protein CobT,cobalamin biosynthesis protein CobT family [Rickettsiaceae bacterium]